jgi:hypothetical protein
MLDPTLTFDDVVLKDESTGADLSAADYVLRRHEETINRTTYVDDTTHSVASRDQVQFYRTFPKRAGSSRGSSKCAVKFTRDVLVPNASGDGDIVLPLIGEVTFSIPVGVSNHVLFNLREKMEQVLAQESVSVTALLTLLEI